MVTIIIVFVSYVVWTMVDTHMMNVKLMDILKSDAEPGLKHELFQAVIGNHAKAFNVASAVVAAIFIVSTIMAL